MGTILSETEIVGTKPRMLSEAQVSGVSDYEKELKAETSPLRIAGRQMLDYGTVAGKVAAATADLVLGIPGQLVGVGADAGARLRAFGGGESRAMQDTAGQLGREMVPEWAMMPVQSVIKRLGGGEAFDQGIVTRALSALAHGTERATGGRLTAGGADSVINTFMAAGGARIGAEAKPSLERALKRFDEAKSPATRARAEDAIREVDVAVEASRGRTEPFRQRMPEILDEAAIVGRTKELRKDIAKRAKEDKPLQEELKARAESTTGPAMWGEHSVEITGEPMRAPDGKMYTPIRQGKNEGFAPSSELSAINTRVVDIPLEPTPVAASDVPPSLKDGIMKLQEGRAWDMTHEERIAVRDAARKTAELPEGALKSAQEKVAAGKKFDLSAEERIALKGQKGEMDPRLIVGFGGGLALGTAALMAYRAWEKSRQEDADAEEKRSLDWMGPGQKPRPVIDPLMQVDRKQFSEASEPGMTAKGVGVAAAAATLPFLGKGASVPFMHGMAGAVKGKGGSWHPEAVRGLAERLGDNLARGVGENALPVGTVQARMDATAAAQKPIHEHAERMIRGYLNKHAGTEADPLAKVEVPFKGGTATWESLMDKTISSRPASHFQEIDALVKPVFDATPDMNWNFKGGLDASKMRPDEPVWNTEHNSSISPGEVKESWRARFNEAAQARDAIKAYLSHVADYLREHVSPEKLGQYDLVRAVKETAQWDKDLAKKMADARKAEKTVSPIYREYPDGMYWQQLTKPGQFARESDAMGHSVRGYEPSPSRQGQPASPDWVKESGDAGHLHYGHGGWDAIKSGEAKVYSLRDAKGESHATVEVGPTSKDFGGNLGRQFTEAPPSITQIKGKQNRAPAEKYLPHVQDFVRNAEKPWGEVGDLGNTGLQDIRELNEPYRRVLDKTHPGQRFITKEDFNKTQPSAEDVNAYHEGTLKDRPRERGAADPKLLAAIAAAGGVAAYLAAHPAEVENVAAAGLLPAGMLGAGKGKTPQFIKAGGAYAGSILKEFDRNLGRNTTRLANIHPELRRQVRDTAHQMGVAITQASDKIEGFTKEMKKLPAERRAAIETAYRNEDSHAMAEAIKGDPKLVSGYRELRNWLNETGETLRGFKRFKEGITDYLPRVVKDYEGLMNALGHEVRAPLEKIMVEAEAKSLREHKRELSEVERSLVVDNYLKSPEGSSRLPGFARTRSVKMSDRLAPFYHGMEESLVKYAHAATMDIATARFFGRDLKQSKQGGKSFTNLDDSIGAVTSRLLDAKKITPQQAVEIQEILRASFGKGQKAPDGWVQDIRNTTGAALLGQIGSGLIQTSEALLSVYHHSLRPAIEAAGILITGRGLSPKEFGLANHVIEEVIGKRFTGQVLSGVLKANLLALFDQVGIRQNLTASYQKNARLARTAAGVEELRAKWGADYGSDFPALIKELRESTPAKRGPLVDSLVYQELSDVRPTSMMEVSQRFNEHPNLRMMWQLKQFMLTQADIVRRDAYNKIKTGEPKEVARGLKNLALYGAALTVVTVPSDYVKDWIMGRDYKYDPAENVMRNFGLSRYSTEKVAQSNAPGKQALNTVGNIVKPPAYSVGETLAEGVTDPKKLVPLIPVGGRAYYNRELGGNENYRLSQAQRERIKARNAREAADPSLKARRLERVEKAKKRKLEKLEQAR